MLLFTKDTQSESDANVNPIQLKLTESNPNNSLMNKIVALKEIRLEAEEGTPFTAIREGS